MKALVRIITVTIAILITVVGCGSPISNGDAGGTSPNKTPASTTEESVASTQQPEGPIPAVWIDTVVEGKEVSISLAEVKQNLNTNFRLETEDKTWNFMAYILDEKLHVRANACPPCRSIGFALEGDILVCDRCATTFEAETGAGIAGACVNFPKEAIDYTISGDIVSMELADLIEAYEETVEPG